MKIKLISSQAKALQELRVDIADALENYQRRKKTQVVSLQPPSGTGKTIIAASLIEDIYFGSTLGGWKHLWGVARDDLPLALRLSGSGTSNPQAEDRSLDHQTAFWPVCDHCRVLLRHGDAGRDRLLQRH